MRLASSQTVNAVTRCSSGELERTQASPSPHRVVVKAMRQATIGSFEK